MSNDRCGAFFIYTMDNNYVEQQKIWIAGQKNNVDQLTYHIEYSQREIELNQKGIEHATQLRQHYLIGIEKYQADLDKYIKENSAQ